MQPTQKKTKTRKQGGQSPALDVANCSAGLVLRLRSIADDECQDDEWMSDVLRQSADKIERMERAALSSLNTQVSGAHTH